MRRTATDMNDRQLQTRTFSRSKEGSKSFPLLVEALGGSSSIIINTITAELEASTMAQLRKVQRLTIVNVAGYKDETNGAETTAGLSLLLSVEYQDDDHDCRQEHLLFNAGPDPEMWRRNAENLSLALSQINTVVLSHHHAAHCGGFRSAIPAIVQAKQKRQDAGPSEDNDVMERNVVMDLSPPIIHQSGSQSNNNGMRPPPIEEYRQMGALLRLNPNAHTAGNSCFYVSGYMPRDVSASTNGRGYGGFDERYVAVCIRDRGIVLVSASSILVTETFCKDVISSQPDDTKLMGVVGGFQLEEQTAQTLQKLDTHVLLAAGQKSDAKLDTTKVQVLNVGDKYVFGSSTDQNEVAGKKRPYPTD